MKKYILVLLALLPLISVAQKKQKDTAKVKMPMIQGTIVYEKIIDSIGKSRSEIYDASLKWLANNFVDSKEVIRIKNPETGNIVGSGNFIYITPGLMGGSERMSFMIDITAKENKVRLRLYQFRYSILGSSGYKTPASSDSDYFTFDKKYKEYLDDKVYPAYNKKLFLLLDEKIRSIQNSYTVSIKSAPLKDDF